MSIFHREPHSYYVNGFLHTLHSNALFLANIAGTNGGRIDMNSYYRGIYQIVSCKHSSIKHLHVYKYYTSLWCSFRTRYILLDNAYGNNKCRYKQHKSCLCTLLQVINHDAVSGWLKLASCFYKTKQYSNATPDKVCRFTEGSDISYKLLQLNSFKKKSIVHLWKIMLVEVIAFEKHSVLTPDELQKEVEHGARSAPSTVFAYFLAFLCHYHLSNVRQCQDSVRDLELVITENYFISDAIEKAHSRNILGIAFQLKLIKFLCELYTGINIKEF